MEMGAEDRHLARVVSARAGLAAVRDVIGVPEAGVNRVLRVIHADGQETAMRLNVRDLHQEKWAREEAVLAIVRARVPELPVPTILFVDETRSIVPWPVEVQRWEDGVRAETLAPHLRPAEALGRYAALLHSVAVPWFGWPDASFRQVPGAGAEGAWPFYVWRNIEDRLAELEASGFGFMPRDRAEALLAALRDRYGAALEALPQAVPHLVHGDLHWGNVLLDQKTGQIRTLLDWEWAQGAVPGLEGSMTTRPVRHSPRFWKGYRSVHPEGPDSGRGRGLRQTLYRSWRALDVAASWARSGTMPAWAPELAKVWDAAATLRRA